MTRLQRAALAFFLLVAFLVAAPRSKTLATSMGGVMSAIVHALHIEGLVTAIGNGAGASTIGNGNGMVACGNGYPCATPTAAPNLTNATLALSPGVYYRMNEGVGTTLVDSSTSALNGTYGSSGITYTGSPLTLNDTHSPVFNGSTNSAASTGVVSGAPLVTTGAFSAVFWVYLTGATNFDSFLGNTTGNSSACGFQINTNGSSQWNLIINTDFDGATGFTAATGPSLNTLYQVALVYVSGGTSALYVNGTSVASSTSIQGNISSCAYPVTIAQSANATGYGISGRESEVSMYNYGLSQSQIQNLYALGTNAATPTPSPTPTASPSPTPTPTATPTVTPTPGALESAILSFSPTFKYPLNETSGTTVNDDSVNANNGTYSSSNIQYSSSPLWSNQTSIGVNGGGYITSPIAGNNAIFVANSAVTGFTVGSLVQSTSTCTAGYCVLWATDSTVNGTGAGFWFGYEPSTGAGCSAGSYAFIAQFQSACYSSPWLQGTHFWATTYNGVNMVIYLDGTAVNTTARSGAAYGGGYNLEFGDSPNGHVSPCGSCQFAFAFLMPSALNSTQIATINTSFDSASPTPSPSPSPTPSPYPSVTASPIALNICVNGQNMANILPTSPPGYGSASGLPIGEFNTSGYTTALYLVNWGYAATSTRIGDVGATYIENYGSPATTITAPITIPAFNGSVSISVANGSPSGIANGTKIQVGVSPYLAGGNYSSALDDNAYIIGTLGSGYGTTTWNLTGVRAYQSFQGPLSYTTIPTTSLAYGTATQVYGISSYATWPGGKLSYGAVNGPYDSYNTISGDGISGVYTGITSPFSITTDTGVTGSPQGLQIQAYPAPSAAGFPNSSPLNNNYTATAVVSPGATWPAEGGTVTVSVASPSAVQNNFEVSLGSRGGGQVFIGHVSGGGCDHNEGCSGNNPSPSPANGPITIYGGHYAEGAQISPISAPAAPTLSLTGGTSTGTQVAAVVTYVTAYNEQTTQSSQTTITPTTAQRVNVTSPSSSGSGGGVSTGYNVYAGVSGGPYYLQNGATPVTIGTTYEIPGTLITGTATPPATNLTGTIPTVGNGNPANLTVWDYIRWVSGTMNKEVDLGFGYADARLRVPAFLTGNSAAWWTLQSQAGYSQYGLARNEVDIQEQFSSVYGSTNMNMGNLLWNQDYENTVAAYWNGGEGQGGVFPVPLPTGTTAANSYQNWGALWQSGGQPTPFPSPVPSPGRVGSPQYGNYVSTAGDTGTFNDSPVAGHVGAIDLSQGYYGKETQATYQLAGPGGYLNPGTVQMDTTTNSFVIPAVYSTSVSVTLANPSNEVVQPGTGIDICNTSGCSNPTIYMHCVVTSYTSPTATCVTANGSGTGYQQNGLSTVGQTLPIGSYVTTQDARNTQSWPQSYWIQWVRMYQATGGSC